MTDLKDRLGQMEMIAADAANSQPVWLGGLFRPQAYITATRQAVAHANGWSLEQLVLTLDIEEKASAESFAIHGTPLDLLDSETDSRTEIGGREMGRW